MGNNYGYQHIWKEADGKANEGNSSLSWLSNGIFYTYLSATTNKDSVILGRVGATDPNFNLRRDPMMILRRKASHTTFASVLEAHGSYSPVTEKAINAYSDIEKIEILNEQKDYTFLKIRNKEKKTWLLVVANQGFQKEKNHSVIIDGKTVNWKGAYKLMVL